MGLLLYFLGGAAIGLIAALIITVAIVTVRKIIEHCRYRIRIHKAKKLLEELFQETEQNEHELSEDELRDLLADDDVIAVRDTTNVTADDIKIFHGTNGTDVKLSRTLDRYPDGVLIDPAAI